MYLWLVVKKKRFTLYYSLQVPLHEILDSQTASLVEEEPRYYGSVSEIIGIERQIRSKRSGRRFSPVVVYFKLLLSLVFLIDDVNTYSIYQVSGGVRRNRTPGNELPLCFAGNELSLFVNKPICACSSLRLFKVYTEMEQ